MQSSNWLPVGIIGIILGVCFLFGGYYAQRYVEWLDTWHTTPFGRVRDYRMPYRQYAFPMYMLGLSLFVVGIVGLAYHLKTQKA